MSIAKFLTLLVVIALGVFCFYGITSCEWKEGIRLPRKIAFWISMAMLFFGLVLFYRFINRLDYKEGFVKGYDKCLDDIKKSPAPDTPKESAKIEQTYIVNKNTKKFHKETCSAVSQMSLKNKVEMTASRTELIEKGYSPCQICKP